MAQKTIKAHMKQRRDTKANWASINPVLLDGELGIVSDDPNLYKVGDGTTAWNGLPFRGFDGTLVHEAGNSETAVMSQKAVTESLTALQESVTEKTQELMRKKADQDGKYPELTAGFANNLVGRGEAVDATINFRPSGGMSIEDGAARVKELKGNSIVWNQLAKNSKFETTENWYKKDVTMSVANNIASVTSTAETDPFANTDIKMIVGHKYLFNGLAKSPNTGTIYKVYYGGAYDYFSASNSKVDTWQQHQAFFTCQTNEYNAVRLQCATNNITNQYKGIQVIDLTQMFGAGNEPTTIEEFYNRIPKNVDLYAYNEGEIISTNAEGIKSVGFNAWDEEWEVGGIGSGDNFPTSDNIRSKNFCRCIGGASYYCRQPSNKVFIFWYDSEKKYISYSEGYSVVAPTSAEYFKITDRGGATYNGGICINLAHSGYRNGEYQPYMQFIRDIDSRIREAFPNGMRSAGTASDKVYNKNGKGYIEKRIGVVDMGSLEWSYDADTKRFSAPMTFSCRIQDYICNIISSIGYYSSAEPISNVVANLAVSFYDYNNRMYLYNLKYTDAATFKAAMSGVMLYYELAEPEILEYDEPFNLDYEVWDFGTEQMIATEPSAPIKASIVYGFNAVDSVRTAQIEIAELKTQIAQMQTIMASMTAQSAALTE